MDPPSVEYLRFTSLPKTSEEICDGCSDPHRAEFLVGCDMAEALVDDFDALLLPRIMHSPPKHSPKWRL
jgi:hypothetical protein